MEGMARGFRQSQGWLVEVQLARLQAATGAQKLTGSNKTIAVTPTLQKLQAVIERSIQGCELEEDSSPLWQTCFPASAGHPAWNHAAVQHNTWVLSLSGSVQLKLHVVCRVRSALLDADSIICVVAAHIHHLGGWDQTALSRITQPVPFQPMCWWPVWLCLKLSTWIHAYLKKNLDPRLPDCQPATQLIG